MYRIVQYIVLKKINIFFHGCWCRIFTLLMPRHSYGAYSAKYKQPHLSSSHTMSAWTYDAHGRLPFCLHSAVFILFFSHYILHKHITSQHITTHQIKYSYYNNKNVVIFGQTLVVDSSTIKRSVKWGFVSTQGDWKCAINAKNIGVHRNIQQTRQS